MKKRLIITGVLTIILGAVTYMVANSINTLNSKAKGEKNTVVLSSLVADLEADHQRQVKEYLKPSLLVYFNSECDHCQAQLKQLDKTPKILQQFQVILVSYQELTTVEDHLEKYQAIAASGYALYQVAPDEVLTTFGKTSVPQLYVYENNLLKKSFKGVTKSELLLKTIGL